MTFDEFMDEKERERAAAPQHVSWRKVGEITGGGYSGLARDGRRVYVRWTGPANRQGTWEYGEQQGRTRKRAGTRRLLIEAKLAAEGLVARRREQQA